MSSKTKGLPANGKHPHQKIICQLAALFLAVALSAGIGRDAAAWTLATADIRVLGIQLNVDTRPDIEGLQSTMTAVKNFPSAVDTRVGLPGSETVPVLSPEWMVKAELAGPGLNTPRTLAAVPNQLMELPIIKVSGEYHLYNIRLEDKAGTPILTRDPTLESVVITVIDKLLVTQVTSRPLTLEEIEEKGIVIEENNYSAMNFTVGLRVGSEPVEIEMPMLIPKTDQGIAHVPPPSASFQFEPARFESINIPNLTLTGFSLAYPDEEPSKDFQLPRIHGVIVIPGNIAFLNQFFSVILQAANVAPEGSGLVLENALAAIRLPLGADDMVSGDDPLRIAETQAHGAQESLPLQDETGTDTIVPGGANQAEFLVEGLREGTHMVDFDITGDLFIPSLGKSVILTGKAAGTVQVKNPTFSMTLAHPDVVREGEAYSLFVTVTNTSTTPANLFQLRLNSRSLSGARLAEGETETKTLDSLPPGQAETLEYRLVARTTGKVTGTVFLADPGINGSFLLNTGVGDTGIPLSPDTLILPQTVDYLPDTPADPVFAAVRLLGQAYSVATAPVGALPPDIARMSKTYVFDRAVKLAQAGLHVRFGEPGRNAVQDLLMDYFGSDLQRLDLLYPDSKNADAVEKDLRAFDALRRKADAGENLSRVLAELIEFDPSAESLAGLQLAWAEYAASRPAHLSFGVHSPGAEVCLRMTDGDGRILGSLTPTDDLPREIPFADRFSLFNDGADRADMIFSAAPESQVYTLEFGFPDGAHGADISLVLPDGGGMIQAVYPSVSLPAGSVGKLVFRPSSGGDLSFMIDTDGDGVSDRTLTPVPAPVPDEPPRLMGVLQWAKGNRPLTGIGFTTGDPFGRMVGLLFSEEVTPETATNPALYRLPEHSIEDIRLQPDRRMVFLMLNEPVGEFILRTLEVGGIEDQRGRPCPAEAAAVAGDPDRGLAGTVSGIVQGPDGTPIPFARIQYIQPVHHPGTVEKWTKDFAISTITADAAGRYQIEFVLQNINVADNADIWLNDTHAAGTDHFKLEAMDPVTGNIGKASTRIQYDGQRMVLNVIIRGYGGIEGTVYDEDGGIVFGGPPGVLSVIAKNISTGEAFLSWVDENGSYAFPRAFQADEGADLSAPWVTVGNLILQVIRSDGYTGIATVNIPAAEMTVTQDIVLIVPSRYGIVTGRVLEADGTTGAAGVLVQIAGKVLTDIGTYDRTYKIGVVGTSHTDETGFFRFENVPAGDTQVQALRQTTYEHVKVADYLHEGEERHLNLVLPGSGAAVTGIVLDAGGDPVAGAAVAGGPTLTETDADGRFEITGLPLGRVTVSAQAPDSPAVGKATVDLLSAETVQEILITLEPVGAVTGTVTEADGITPVAGQKVQLWVGEKGVMAETYTDENGRYGFVNYPVESYTVKAVRRDFGDGGMAYTAIRYARDTRIADIRFRGLGQIKGRVEQTNGTPVITDVVIVRKVWRIISQQTGATDNYYLDYVEAMQNEVGGETAGAIEEVLDATGATVPPQEFFMLLDEPVLISSDILGPGGEVTGEFHYTGSVTGGPFTVTALSGFLAPAEVTGEIPRTADPEERIVDVGVIVLEPATGQLQGRVYMPDGEAPVGEGVKVTVKPLGSSGSVKLPGIYGGSVSQPKLPPMETTTDEAGCFEFPLVPRGGFVLTADTGVPDLPTPEGHDDMETEVFSDEDGKRLNVRLFGRQNGAVPAGGTVTADIRLQDAAWVRVTVHQRDADGATYPAAGARVSLSTDSALDEDLADFFTDQHTDADGVIDFFPVIEGDFSVIAAEQNSPVTGRAAGTVAASAQKEVIPVTVTLGAVTTDTGELIEAEIFGTVTGTVYQADGLPLENPAQVRIRASGASLLTTSDSTGGFQVDFVPGGGFSVEAFEPYTARRGTAFGEIAVDGETVDADVTLVGLGTVLGQVFDAAGQEIIQAADVILYPSGNFTEPLISRSDQRGGYFLPGVPVGNYTVKANDYNSGLSGEVQGRMASDGDTNTTDVYLQPAGMITGEVRTAEGQPALGVEVLISGRGTRRTVVTDFNDGTFSSGDFLLMGTYTLTARTDNDGASATVDLSYHGQEAAVTLTFNGTGTVQGVILDSTCADAVSYAEVILRSRSPFSSGSQIAHSDENGYFEFTDVPVGDFTISVKTLVEPILGAAAAGSLKDNHEVFEFSDNKAICLQESGGITGIVFRADAVTPAAEAVVEAARSGVRLVRIADASGGFAFDGLPLGEWAVSIQDPVSGGRAARTASILNNEQTVPLGDIVLDEAAPRIVSTDPAADSAGIDPARPVKITFSEPVDPATVDGDTVRVTVDGAPIDGAVQVADAVLTFTPDPRLPDLRQIRVFVKGDKIGFQGEVLESGIRDLSGRGLAADHILLFSTRDASPPAVKSISPADGAEGVSIDSVVRVEFTEPVDPASVLSFTLRADDTEVAGSMNSEPILGNRVFVFTPAERLAPDTAYTAVLTGAPVRDTAGNAMAETRITAGFATLDTLPPVINAFYCPDGAQLIPGAAVELTVAADPPGDAASVEIYRSGLLVATLTEAPFTYTLAIDPAFESPVEMAVVAVDAAGNRSAAKTLALNLAANQHPVVDIADPADGIRVSLGQTVNVIIDASDDLALARISYTANNGYVASGAIEAAGAAEESARFSFTVPADFLAGTPIQLQAAATDTLGQRSVSVVVTLMVDDQTGPEVFFMAPADQTRVFPGDALQVRVRADDAGGVAEVRLTAAGAGVDFTEIRGVGGDPLPASVSEEFQLPIPDDAESGGTVTISAAASDAAGNETGTPARLTLTVADTVPPGVDHIDYQGGAVAVTVVSPVRVVFNEPVDPASVTADAVRVLQGSQPVAGLWVLTEGDTRLIWIPAEAFGFGLTYTVEINGVADLSGNAMETPYSTAFTTTDFAVSQPASDAVVTAGDELALQSTGTDPAGITQVEYRADDAWIGTGPAPVPFEFRWPVPAGTLGPVTLSARALAAGNNLALDAVVRASAGTEAYDFAPQRAADGRIDGRFSGGSVAAVLGNPRAWWEADIGRIEIIGRVHIHPHSGCCEETARFAVLVAAEPFVDDDFAGDTLPETYVNGAVEVYRTNPDDTLGSVYETGTVEFDGPFIGRYVRVVHLGEDFLGLAEVEIFGRETLLTVPGTVQITATVP